jgi:putative oxidoreductase
MKKLLTLDFIPPSHDLGLLVLRVWLGASIFGLHGLAKLKNFGGQVEQFKGMGIHPVLGSAAILSESIFAILLIIGLATRVSALFLAATMSYAFFVVHKQVLSGQGSGELAFIYLAGFVTLLIAGAGRFSVDQKLLR